MSSDHGSVASSPGVSRIAVLTLWFALLAGFIEAAWRAIERYELSIRAGPELGPVSMISNGLHYIVTDKDSIELYHYINDPSETSSLHESPEHTEILAGFRRLSDSLSALCSRVRARTLTLSSESDDDH